MGLGGLAGELLFACKAMAVAETPKLAEVGIFWPVGITCDLFQRNQVPTSENLGGLWQMTLWQGDLSKASQLWPGGRELEWGQWPNKG